MDEAIRATGLRKVYRSGVRRTPFEALRGLNLVVPRGIAFGLIGPNGAGKTTFIKAMLGVVRPSEGDVRVLGDPPDSPAAHRRMGYLPERLELPAAWTPLQFLRSTARLKGLDSDQRPLEQLLHRMGLSAALHRRMGGFSKGMKQRVGLATALLGAPDLLILDEPTDGVDPVGRRDIRTILGEERARGATIFLNSHLLSETERVCDRIGLLVDGRIAREGSLQELTAPGTAYHVRFHHGASTEALCAAGFVPTAADQFSIDASSPEALNQALDAARRSGALAGC